MASRSGDVRQLLLQVDASVELAQRNLGKLRSQVANDTHAMEGSLSRIDKGSTGLGTSFGKVQSAGNSMLSMFGLGAIGVTTFGAALIVVAKNAEEHAQALRMLGAVLDATGNKTGMTTAQLVEFSEQMENSLAISQEEILKAQTVLAQYDGVAGTTFNRSIELAADLAAVFGGDLASNTEKLGGALQNLATGNVEGLTRGFKFLGTETLETVKHLAEVGKTAEAQAALLKALEERVGGAGETKAQGLAGAFFRLTDAIGDASREMLNQLGILPNLIRGLNQLAEDFTPDKKTNLQLAAEARVEMLKAQGQLDAARRTAATNSEGRVGVMRVDKLELVVKKWSDAVDKYTAAARADMVERQRLEAAAAEATREAQVIADKNAKEREKGGTVSPGDQITAERRLEMLRDAQRMIGLKEGDNALRALFNDAGIAVDPRMTAWCAAFVNAVLASNGLPGTGSLSARSFLGYGTATEKPEKGDIVVLSRGSNAAQGHVGFFDSFDAKGNVRVTGGNQGNAVNTESFARNRVLGFRRAPDIASVLAGTPSDAELRLAGAEYNPPLGVEDLELLEEYKVNWEELDQIIAGLPKVENAISPEEFERLEDFKDGIASLAEDVLRVGFGLEDWSFGDLVDKFKQLVIQLLVIEPIVARIREAMSGLGGGGGGGILGLLSGLGSIFGGGSSAVHSLGAASAGAAIGARASGGPVGAGRLYMVGERGPELFRPSASGRIVPNHMLGGGGTTIIMQGVITNDQFWGEIDQRDNVSVMRGANSGAEIAQTRMGRARRRSLVAR